MRLRRASVVPKQKYLPFSTFPNNTYSQEGSKANLQADRPTINAINHDLFNTFKSILINMHNEDNNNAAINAARGGVSYKPNHPQTLIERQIEIEEQQHSAAVNEQAEMISSLRQLGKGTSVKRVQRSLVKWYEPLTAALTEEIEMIEKSVPGGDRTVRNRI